jgi:hypothetical protein
MAQAIIGSRADQGDVGVSVDGVDLGVFDQLTGGEMDSEETTYQLGGMGPRISLGGAQTPATITVSRIYDLARDHTIIHWLMSRAGKGDVVVRKKSLDVDGNAFGRALTYTGRLKMVKPPELDSESSSAAKLDLEITPNSIVA